MTHTKKAIAGQFVLIDNEKYYEIKNYDEMLPFFISLASDSDHWMYISSTGGLTAGRKNPDTALFPYYTDDKVSESAEVTGSKTIIQVNKKGQIYLWEPFSDIQKGNYRLERSIAKSTIGNKLIFTEHNVDLELTFSYQWMNTDDFGWIKKSRLHNESSASIEVYVVDGLQNILPSGIDRLTQNTFSTLVDAYKKTELIENCQLALFRMESILVDRAEPSESLRVNTVWTHGLENCNYLLSSTQLKAVRNAEKVCTETEAKGMRGAFFACSDVVLSAKERKEWYFVAEVDQDSVAVNNLIYFIENNANKAQVIEQNIHKGTQNLVSIVSNADGIQQTADENGVARHYSNVLFNTMRGGIYSDNYSITSAFFRTHIQHFNQTCWEKHSDFLMSIPKKIEYKALEILIEQQEDSNLYRLFLEYLPLTFSRRHGDPSRPWNLFDINIKDEHGDKLLSYQGNWRDIFQNWEALSLSYPVYINGIIAKFLNASTADGYNPYKITNKGFEWEVIEPENPWSNIGYWGDHQIIYLQKLLEISQQHYPKQLSSWLNKEIFAYANVPYRLKSYAEIVQNPKNSIHFDDELHTYINKKVPTYGADAKLIINRKGEVLLVSFTEKLLATLLSKLSNFIPEAGIWMNTLRPEWNDANNALVGTGTSMVTLYYMRRFVSFAIGIYKNSTQNSFSVTQEIQEFFEGIKDAFTTFEFAINNGIDDNQRRSICDALGIAGEKYRYNIYKGFKEERGLIAKPDLLSFFQLCLTYIDQSINANKRSDGMYHSYNLVTFKKETVEIRRLYEMLEGQVAILSSGKLNAQEVVALLDALRQSELYRDDQKSFLLYPNKTLPTFLEKNNINPAAIKEIPLLSELIKNNDKRILSKDLKGQFHFNASFKNATFLHEVLITLQREAIYEVSDADIEYIESLYEKTFNHQSFTGRSGTFYKYEGLGCIYWHMVSKLLLAIGENISWAVDHQETQIIINTLKTHYNEVKQGIGADKAPDEYGSFPFDPYSHTPTMAGVQQPGMTGQVKEDIISRFMELGIKVSNGCITIAPQLISDNAYMLKKNGDKQLTFSYCSVPFKYMINGKTGIDVFYKSGKIVSSATYTLTEDISTEVFNRISSIQEILVYIPEKYC